ncbi:Retrovirus-related Pol poly from transposon [Brachionus plicatilis]|uniref:Retrovirus-related Pol poly from transposon n=1 Tax=Brachionus plicatilis TaxID=10195 RepID=A0A3M7Q9W5_BRAPC|nr:Retrovirus-related Pol poly from transposon [Brachionus plicatilis]
MDGSVCVPSNDKAPGRDDGPVRHSPSGTHRSLQVRRRQGRTPRDPGQSCAHHVNPALREQVLRGGRRLDTRKGSQYCPQCRWTDEANPEIARRARTSPVQHGPRPIHAQREAEMFTLSIQGNSLIYLNQNIFINWALQDNGNIYWKCSLNRKSDCKASVTTVGMSKEIYSSNLTHFGHNDVTDLDVRLLKCMNTVNKRAGNEYVSLHSIYRDEINTILEENYDIDELAAKMPKFDNVNEKFYLKRNSDIPSIPKSLQNIDLSNPRYTIEMQRNEYKSKSKNRKNESKSAEIKGCYFHFIQCLWKNIQQKQLVNEYKSNIEYRKWFDQLKSLAFVPLNYVNVAYNYLLQIIPFNLRTNSKFALFMNYFYTTWMFNGQFEINLWNQFYNNGPRTYNHVEGLRQIVRVRICLIYKPRNCADDFNVRRRPEYVYRDNKILKWKNNEKKQEQDPESAKKIEEYKQLVENAFKNFTEINGFGINLLKSDISQN